jgi:DNA-binding MarR family transcriptional regulator
MKESSYDPEQFIGYLLASTRKQLVGRLNRTLVSESSDITFEQWTVMMRLWKRDGISQQELAICCDRDKTTLTRLLDNLEKQHYIRRVEDTSDRRNKLIYLSEKGENLRNKLWPLALEVEAEAQQGLSDEELSTFKMVLEKIRKNLS